MPSPVRRSTRAAQVPEKRPQPTSTASSSSLSSAKVMRGKNSNAKSATPHSLSSEEPSEPPRRSKRAVLQADEEAIQDTTEHDENAGEEEEVTRCICGQQEYPGPPESEAFTAAEAQSEDAGGLFIQCDGCSVWQHGGCVGIVEESQCPDKYYCEECRPKQHTVHIDSKGQRYSLYLPLYPKAHRKSSVSKHDDKARKERESAASRGSTEPGKRRATMRSKEHDDEEEQLKRAIEESKRDNGSTGSSKRSGKRSRDDSEDSKETKRQRRVSESEPLGVRTASLEFESEDEHGMPVTASKAKKARAEAALTARNTEMREKEKMRAQERAEAAGRRQERAGRRRVEDGELGDETPRPSSRPSPPPSSQPSPPPPAVPLTIPHKKTGKKTKKLGNNQYTKARELAAAGITSSPHSKKRQLAGLGPASGDEQGANGESKHSPSHEPVNGNGKGKYGKGKNKALNGANKQPTGEEIENMKSIPNQRRAMDAMQAYITKTQLEMAGDKTPPGSDALPRANGIEEVAPMESVGDGAVQLPVENGGRDFSGLSALEMADVLSRNIHKWQSRFGVMATS